MGFKKILVRFTVALLFAMLLMIAYFEFGRHIQIEPVDFSRDVYEKDFFDRSFTLINDFPVVKFVKAVQYEMDGMRIPVSVEAYFSQEQGWPLSYCYLIIFAIQGQENANAVLTKLKAKYGEPVHHRRLESDVSGNTQEIHYAYWKVDGTELVMPPEEDLARSETWAVTWKFTRPSIPFLTYITVKKWVISNLPISLQPDWAKLVSQAKLTNTD